MPTSIYDMIKEDEPFKDILHAIETNPALLDSSTFEANPLYAARHSERELREVLRKKDIVKQFKDGTTCLMVWVLEKKLNKIKNYISTHPNALRKMDCRGYTAVYWAAAAGRFSILSYFFSLPNMASSIQMRNQLFEGLAEHHYQYTMDTSHQDFFIDNCWATIEYTRSLTERTTSSDKRLVISCWMLGSYYLEKKNIIKAKAALMQSKKICLDLEESEFKSTTLDSINEQLEAAESIEVQSFPQEKQAFRVKIHPKKLVDQIKVIALKDQSPEVNKSRHELEDELIRILAQNCVYFFSIPNHERSRGFYNDEYLELMSQLTNISLRDKRRIVEQCLAMTQIQPILNQDDFVKDKKTLLIKFEELKMHFYKESALRIDKTIESIYQNVKAMGLSENVEIMGIFKTINKSVTQCIEGELKSAEQHLARVLEEYQQIEDKRFQNDEFSRMLNLVIHLLTEWIKILKLQKLIDPLEAIDVCSLEKEPYPMEAFEKQMAVGDEHFQNQRFMEALVAYFLTQSDYLKYRNSHPADLSSETRSFASIIEQRQMTARSNLELNTEAKLRGFTHENVPADGNCFFHAIAAQIGSDHLRLRELTANYIADHLEEYKPFLETQEALLVYIQELRKEGTHADNLAISALSTILQRSIVIFHASHEAPNIIKPKFVREQAPLFVGYESRNINQLRIGHYQIFRENPDAPPLRNIHELIKTTPPNIVEHSPQVKSEKKRTLLAENARFLPSQADSKRLCSAEVDGAASSCNLSG